MMKENKIRIQNVEGQICVQGSEIIVPSLIPPFKVECKLMTNARTLGYTLTPNFQLETELSPFEP